MKQMYFEAIELPEKPFISWADIGTFTPTEFAASHYCENPLVVREDEIPSYAWGVSTKKIDDGELVDRSPAEMLVFEAEYNKIMAIKNDANRLPEINANSFTYDSKEFPMDPVSRLFYTAIKETATNHKVRTMDNTAYALDDSDRAAFYSAYIAKLLSISKHTV